MKIPIYSSKEQVGDPKTWPVKQDRVFKNPWAEAVKGSIDVVSEGMAKIEYERDEMDVVKALGKLGDAERLYLAEEEARPLTEAAGTLNRGGDWYKESINNIGGGLRSKQAKDMFTMKAELKRANGLNHLAGHMANQHKVQKKHELEGLQANIYSDINVGINPEQLDASIKELEVKITGYYKGANSDAIKLNAKTGLINAFLKDAAISNPESIPGLLKRYDKNMSEVDKKAILNMAEKTLNGMEIGDLYDDIKAQYSNDPAAALAKAYELKVTDAPPGIVNAVRDLLKDEFATYGHFKSAENKRVQTVAEAKAVQLWERGNYVGLRRHVMTKMIEPGRVEHWVDKLNTAEKSVKDGNNNPYDKSDLSVKAQLTETIMTAPHTLDQSVIWNMNGQGLSTSDCTTLAKMWEERSVKGSNPKEVEVANILKWYRQNNQFDSDTIENQQIHDRLLTECFAWSSANPEGDVVEYMKTKLNALGEYTWAKQRWDAFKGFFAPPEIDRDEAPVDPVLPGDLEDMVGWGDHSPSRNKVTIEFQSHKARRILDRELDKYNKEK